jgi:hypothetical protein
MMESIILIWKIIFYYEVYLEFWNLGSLGNPQYKL